MRKHVVATLLVLLSLPASAATFAKGSPSTTNNDDTCDIAYMPAATLLLPYFEVDLDARTGENTIFTITNTGQLPQVARVTLWTDYAYPVIAFNIFLTGYDVQSINLFDVIAGGRIAPDDGTGFDVSPVGKLSGGDDTFDNPLVREDTCVDLPVQLPSVLVSRLRQAFTQGGVPSLGSQPECPVVGIKHPHAIGYATVDVVGLCSATLPIEAAYFRDEIRFDNVLIGDYLQFRTGDDFAGGNPMVHIRAMPDDEVADRSTVPVNLPKTFYSRYLPAGSRIDARQPLPALFAARWISGGPAQFETAYKIWREGFTNPTTACFNYPRDATVGMTEIVRFDEEENPEALAHDLGPTPVRLPPYFPATSRAPVSDDYFFPPAAGGAVAGWMYLNMDSRNAGSLPATQTWIVVSMSAVGRLSVESDAAVLGNGCTPETDYSEAVGGTRPIGPAPSFNPPPP